MPLILLSLLFAFAAWIWLRTQPANQRGRALIKLLLLVMALGVVFLAITGRFYVVMGLLAAMVPFLRRLLPGLLLGRLGKRVFGGMGGMGGGATRASPGQQSRVASEVLEMTLDHDSGDMDGKVIKGPMQGQQLSEMTTESEFIELLTYCRETDADSARLLETYMDKRFGDAWRADDPGAGDNTDQSNEGGDGVMSEHEALDILGLEPGASKDDIVQAHRRLMQKMHPDRGGSTYLAARINEAKKTLID